MTSVIGAGVGGVTDRDRLYAKRQSSSPVVLSKGDLDTSPLSINNLQSFSSVSASVIMERSLPRQHVSLQSSMSWDDVLRSFDSWSNFPCAYFYSIWAGGETRASIH